MEYTEEIFLKYLNENIGIAHKISRVWFRDEDDRQDVLQEMIFQLWKSFPRYRAEAKFATWMYRVCLNTAITFLSKRPRHVTMEEQYESIAAADEEKSDKAESLYAMIGSLVPADRAIILLHLDGYSYEEISQITGLTRTNVSVKLVRIKKNIENQLKK